MKRITWATRIRAVKMYAVYAPLDQKVLRLFRFKKDAAKYREGLRDVVIVELKGIYAMPRHLYAASGEDFK